MEVEVDELVQEILYRSDCLRALKHFIGVKKDGFLRYSIDDIRVRLPGTDEFQAMALKIFEELSNFKNIADKKINGDSRVKALNLETTNGVRSTNGETSASNRSILSNGKSSKISNLSEVLNNSDLSNDDSDDDISIQPLPEPPRKPENLVELTLDSSSSDDENVGQSSQPQPPSIATAEKPRRSARARRQASSRSSYEDFFLSSASSGNESEPEAKRIKKEEIVDGVLTVTNPRQALAKLRRNRDYLDECSKVKIMPDDLYEHYHICSNEPPATEVDEWIKFFKTGGTKIKALELHLWSWKKPGSKCPYNLVNILMKYCLKLQELSIRIGLVDGALDNYVYPSASTPLKYLTKLTINHKNKLLYMDQLKSMLKAATNLERFEYWYWDHEDLEQILETFCIFSDMRCKSIRSFVIRACQPDGFLKSKHLKSIGEIPMNSLEVLELGNGYWEDCTAEVVEDMLKTFPTLKSFTMNGNYVGDSLHKPDITIKIPPLASLETINIGGNYEFASVNESQLPSPTSGSNGGNVITICDDLHQELFSISIKLPLLLNLETLVLGNLYKIDDLHFASLKSLKTFRVGSPWHLSVIFPPESSRNNSYPLIKELQLPDCLKDPSFVTKIPTRFPNLKKCWIYLPSVIVLRTFLKCMEHSDLEYLYLKTQFDFPSALETCLAPKRKLKARHYEDELILQDLNEFEESKRNEFINFHNIELPLTEKQIRDLEDDGTYEGIKSLKRLRVLHMEHIPRRLRIPKGNLHWTHHQAKFSNGYIGFLTYPITDKCLKTIPMKNLFRCKWPNFNVSTCRGKTLVEAGFTRCSSNAADAVESGRIFDYNYNGPSTSTSRQNQVDMKPQLSRKTKRAEKLKVQIQPAMLQANFTFRKKDEKT